MTLRRSTPEEIREWRARSKQLKRGEPMKRSGPIRSGRSKRRQDFEKELARMRPQVIARSLGRCERGCGRKGQHVHHRKRRSQGGTNDLANLAHLCIRCHEEVHRDVVGARRDGWLMKRYQDPMLVKTVPLRRVA